MAHPVYPRYEFDPNGGHPAVFGMLSILALIVPSSASAMEVTWEGHYRTRVRYFDTLSLATVENNEFSEESSMWTDHRLQLLPSFVFSDAVRIRTGLKVLPFNTFGAHPVSMADPVTGEETAQAYAYGIRSGEGETDIAIDYAYGEVDAGFGQFRFGRMPVEWGSGMVYNAGLDPLSEYGDNADRLQITAPVGPVYLIGAIETSAENFINADDDMLTYTGGVAYLGERYGLGSYNTYRVAKFGDDSKYTLFTGDLWARVQLGMTSLEWEFAFQTGGGNLSEDVNDVTITGIGTQLTALVGGDTLRVGASGGLATGDQDPYDNEYRTFSFDPDFNVALMMFEESMPVLAHENPHSQNNGGREWGAVRLGEGVSNALYVRPAIQYTVKEGLDLELAWIGARAAKLPESDMDDKGYGSEFDFTVDYRPFDHFQLSSTTGVFMPGKYISSYENEELGGGFDDAAIGSRLVGTIQF